MKKVTLFLCTDLQTIKKDYKLFYDTVSKKIKIAKIFYKDRHILPIEGLLML